MQKEKTEKRASELSESALGQKESETPNDFTENNYWKINLDYSIEDLMADYS